ncbi:MAG: hypothetical protein K9N06_09135 [Candidatus Cloacimonetes bacterium]|nr:hypothetical protein [Candidatus Cloacimonadota bacterium]
MKKIIIIIMVLILGCFSSAETHRIGKIKGNIWNEFTRNLLEIEIDFCYNVETKEFSLLFNTPLNPIELVISEEYRAEMEKSLRSFRRKLRQAELQEEKYDLELSVLPVAVCRFEKGKTWFDSQINSTTNFFSQSKDIHQFILITSAMKENGDGVMKRDGLTVYIDSSEIKGMQELFKEETFQKYQKK